MSYAQNNARLAAVANALQGKFALVREFDSLKLIYILSADCLLNPGSKRLTAFDIHIAAVVYTRSTSSQFVLSTAWKSFIAFDLVALFAIDGSPVAVNSAAVPPTPSFARPQAAPAPQVINPPSTWTQSLDMLERSAGSCGGIEGLPCVFADEDAMAALLGSASAPPAPTPVYRTSSCAGRRESYGAIAPLVPNFSISH
jgi:hypothetical protein